MPYYLSDETYTDVTQLLAARPRVSSTGFGDGGAARQVCFVRIDTKYTISHFYYCYPTARNGDDLSWTEYGKSLVVGANNERLKKGARTIAVRFGNYDDGAGNIWPVYVAVGAGLADVNDSECEGCGWLTEDLDPTTTALQLSIPTALGRCACIDVDQATDDDDAENQFYLMYDGASSSWKGIHNFKTCCGCGTVTFVQDAAHATGTLTIQINRSCQSGSMYSFTFVPECCKAGQITFAGFGPDNCSGDLQGCVNFFRVKLECIPIPECLTCECTGCRRCCIGGQAPTIWKVESGGWTGDCMIMGGVWWLEHVTGSGCLWQLFKDDTPGSGSGSGDGGCGFTITMNFVDRGGPDDVFQVVFNGPGGGGTYEKLADDFGCCSANTLSRVGAGSCGAPDTITLTPAPCAADCDPTTGCGILPTTLHATVTATSGGCGCVPTSIVMTGDGVHPSWSYFGSGECDPDVHVECTGSNQWIASSEALGWTVPVTVACNPIATSFTLIRNPDQPNPPCDGSVTWTVTE